MKTIPLTKGLVALVDDEDYEHLGQFRWYATAAGYAARKVPHPLRRGTESMELMHRTIMGLKFGDSAICDHIDRNRVNNQRFNLRLATHAQNISNVGMMSSNTSGFKGVTRHKQSGKWQAAVKKDGKSIYLGLFATPEEAHQVYVMAAKKLHGEFFGLTNQEQKEPA